MHQERIETTTGAILNTYWLAPKAPRAIVQINHGLAEHAARYQLFMNALAQAEIATVAHDHRGHGETRAPESSLGVFAQKDGARKVIEDTLFIQDWCTDRWEGVPLISFGHSMGGLVALNAAVTCPDRLDGLSVWNSNATLGALGRIAQMMVRAERAMRSAKAPSSILPALSFRAWDKQFAAEGGPFRWLSRKNDVVTSYVEDPLCGFNASTSMWADVLSLAATGDDARLLKALPSRLPIYLVGGGKDPATQGGQALETLAKRLKEVGAQHVSVKLYPEARHETLNDNESEVATEDFINWVRGLSAS